MKESRIILTAVSSIKPKNRAVLHTALRAPQEKIINIEGKDIVAKTQKVKSKIKDLASDVIEEKLKGHS